MLFMRLPSCNLCSMVQFVVSMAESMLSECLLRWISRLRLRWRTLATHSQFNNDSSCSQILSTSSIFWTKGEHQQCQQSASPQKPFTIRSSPLPMQPWWKSTDAYSHHPPETLHHSSAWNTRIRSSPQAEAKTSLRGDQSAL